VFFQAIETAGAQDAIAGGQITVFAPTDDAIEAVPDLAGNLADPEFATAFVNGHLVTSGPLDVAQLNAAGTVTTAGQQQLMIANGEVTGPIGPTPVPITDPDQRATNGFVHGLEGVLFVPQPPAPAPDTQGSVPTGS
jgi:uncharacterized surface protein with fasciclin (FAS1) repeats